MKKLYTFIIIVLLLTISMAPVNGASVLSFANKTMKINESTVLTVNSKTIATATSSNKQIATVTQQKEKYTKTVTKKVKKAYYVTVKKKKKVKVSYKKNGKKRYKYVYKTYKTKVKKYKTVTTKVKETATRAINKFTIRSLKAGTANINVKIGKNSYKSSIKVENKEVIYNIYIGQIYSSKEKIGTNSGQYESSDKKIALVDNNGYVMPIDKGKVTITNKTTKKSVVYNCIDNGNVEVGVDVSYHNGTVNYSQLKEYGMDFVIIRGGNAHKKYATTNSEGVDLNLQKNINGATNVGLKYGIYWYMDANNGSGLMTESHAKIQAETLAKALKSYQTSQFKLPIYLDLEDKEALVTGSTSSERAKYQQKLVEAFKGVLNSYGFDNVGIYASTSWYKSYLANDYFMNNYTSKWIAHYSYDSATRSTITPTVTYKGVSYTPDLWQTGSSFTIYNNKTKFDVNYRYL